MSEFLKKEEDLVNLKKLLHHFEENVKNSSTRLQLKKEESDEVEVKLNRILDKLNSIVETIDKLELFYPSTINDPRQNNGHIVPLKIT